jgi:tight adherence protein C
MDNLLIITAMVFMSVVFAVMGVFMFIRSRMERRVLLEKIQHDGSLAASGAIDGGASETRSDVSPFVRLSMWLGNLVKPKDENEISKRRLLFLRAGYRQRSVPVLFLGLQLLFAAALPMAFLVLQNLYLHMPSIYVLLLAAALALVGFSLPQIWLKLKISSRKEKITEGFPDALDLLLVCVEAGMGLDQAVSRVSIEMEDTCKPISEEFKTFIMEMRVGLTRRDALKNLSARTDLDDVNSLVNLIIQTEKFGSSIGQALRVHSDTMRTKRHQRAEERAAKIPTKLIFPVLLFIFPGMFIVFLAPPLIQLFRMWKGA